MSPEVGDRPQRLLSLVHSFHILLRPLAGYVVLAAQPPDQLPDDAVVDMHVDDLVTAASPDLRGR